VPEGDCSKMFWQFYECQWVVGASIPWGVAYVEWNVRRSRTHAHAPAAAAGPGWVREIGETPRVRLRPCRDMPSVVAFEFVPGMSANRTGGDEARRGELL